jgi:hypothetical protein
MKISKAENRDRKIHKKKHGMRINGRSLFTIQEILRNRSELIKKEREE